MKKIFTSAALAIFCAFASSAAITVTVDGKPIENEATVKFTADDFKSSPMGPVFRFIAEKEFVISADAAPIQFTLLSDNGTGFGFCPDVCYAPELRGDTYTNSGELTKKENTVSIHKEYVMQPSLPKSQCYMSVQLSQGDDFFAFVIEVDTEAAGVGNVDAASQVSFANNAVSYSLAAPSELAVYSITGSKVLSRTVSGTGSVELSHLSKGVYIYTLAGKTSRVLVK